MEEFQQAESAADIAKAAAVVAAGLSVAVAAGVAAAAAEGAYQASRSAMAKYEKALAISRKAAQLEMAQVFARQNAMTVAKVASLSAQLCGQNALMKAEQASWLRERQLYDEELAAERNVRVQLDQAQREVADLQVHLSRKETNLDAALSAAAQSGESLAAANVQIKANAKRLLLRRSALIAKLQMSRSVERWRRYCDWYVPARQQAADLEDALATAHTQRQDAEQDAESLARQQGVESLALLLRLQLKKWTASRVQKAWSQWCREVAREVARLTLLTETAANRAHEKALQIAQTSTAQFTAESVQAAQRISTLEAKWQQYEVQLKLSVIQRAAERALAVQARVAAVAQARQQTNGEAASLRAKLAQSVKDRDSSALKAAQMRAERAALQREVAQLKLDQAYGSNPNLHCNALANGKGYEAGHSRMRRLRGEVGHGFDSEKFDDSSSSVALHGSADLDSNNSSVGGGGGGRERLYLLSQGPGHHQAGQMAPRRNTTNVVGTLTTSTTSRTLKHRGRRQNDYKGYGGDEGSEADWTGADRRRVVSTREVGSAVGPRGYQGQEDASTGHGWGGEMPTRLAREQEKQDKQEKQPSRQPTKQSVFTRVVDMQGSRGERGVGLAQRQSPLLQRTHSATRLQEQESERLREEEANRLREEEEVIRLRKEEAIRLQEGEAARLREGEAARLREGEAARLREGEAARLREGEVIRLREEEARLREGEARLREEEDAARREEEAIVAIHWAVATALAAAAAASVAIAALEAAMATPVVNTTNTAINGGYAISNVHNLSSRYGTSVTSTTTKDAVETSTDAFSSVSQQTVAEEKAQAQIFKLQREKAEVQIYLN
jgi:hypothetical protein